MQHIEKMETIKWKRRAKLNIKQVYKKAFTFVSYFWHSSCQSFHEVKIADIKTAEKVAKKVTKKMYKIKTLTNN
jgi:hypothetical protein